MMKRTIVFAVTALLLAGAASAQCPMMAQAAEGDQPPAMACPRGMQQGMMMRQGPAASMAAALDTAVWGEHVYVLQGNTLEKRDMDGNTVQSVMLEDMESMMTQMEEDGICPMCGMPMEMEMREGCPGAAEGMPCPTCPGMGMGMGGGMQDGMGMQARDGQGMGMMHGRMMEGQGEDGETMGMSTLGMQGMQRGRMHEAVRLQADANGVYLLRGGKFTRFDHDLNEVNSWPAISEACMMRDDATECVMRQMRRSSCPTCRMMMGRVVDQRGIANGTVTMWHRPATLTEGPARFQVQVRGGDNRGDANATVTGYLYPKGNVSAGMGVPMQSVGGGTFYGLVDIPNDGMWELALRVKRPAMQDAVLYYNLPVE